MLLGGALGAILLCNLCFNPALMTENQRTEALEDSDYERTRTYDDTVPVQSIESVSGTQR